MLEINTTIILEQTRPTPVAMLDRANTFDRLSVGLGGFDFMLLLRSILMA